MRQEPVLVFVVTFANSGGLMAAAPSHPAPLRAIPPAVVACHQRACERLAARRRNALALLIPPFGWPRYTVCPGSYRSFASP